MTFHATTSIRRSGWTPENAYPRSAIGVSGLRYYSPSLGRWLSRDPIAERGFRNLRNRVSFRRDSRVDSLAPRLREEIDRHLNGLLPSSDVLTSLIVTPEVGQSADYGFCHNSPWNYVDPHGLSELPPWMCRGLRWARFGELMIAYEYYRYANACFSRAEAECASLRPGQMYAFPAVPGTSVYVVYRYKNVPIKEQGSCDCSCMECCAPGIMIIIPRDGAPPLPEGIYIDPLYQPSCPSGA
jgi:hypothetical protein